MFSRLMNILGSFSGSPTPQEEETMTNEVVKNQPDPIPEVVPTVSEKTDETESIGSRLKARIRKDVGNHLKLYRSETAAFRQICTETILDTIKTRIDSQQTKMSYNGVIYCEGKYLRTDGYTMSFNFSLNDGDDGRFILRCVERSWCDRADFIAVCDQVAEALSDTYRADHLDDLVELVYMFEPLDVVEVEHE